MSGGSAMCSRTAVNTLFLFLVHVNLCTITHSSVYPTSLRYRRQAACKDTDFTCKNAQCIPSFNVCDGIKDCSDSSDENNSTCSHMGRCPPDSFRCDYGACIDQHKRCDGSSDCVDGSDEVKCGTSSTDCSAEQYQCQNNECVDLYSTCDGIQDCSDGSDETRLLCIDLVCLPKSFKCAYGACLEDKVKCDGKADCHDGSDENICSSTNTFSPTTSDSDIGNASCRLPAHPAHGVYTSTCPDGDQRPACRNVPGTPVPDNWLIKYNCNENYDLISTAQFSVCNAGKWNNPLDCIKLCPPLKSLSVDVRCEVDGREVSCLQQMKPSTKAYVTCKQHYKLQFIPEYSYLECLNGGEWNYRLFYCVPDCGVSIKNEQFQSLIRGGESTQQGEYPWLAALYGRNKTNLWEQNCAGTLINTHIILTAAHCLMFSDGIIKPENIKVGLGKFWRDFYKHENYSLIANVREVIVPDNYAGASTHYALDIGLLDLAESVIVTAFIMPACVDWTSIFTITSGDIGHVAGWGNTGNSISSNTILSANLTYIDNAACVKQVRQALRKLVTHDKFCAGSINGSQVDKGDSGGGLTVVKNNGQHFVIGVVSTKIIEAKTFTLFTDITNPQHHSWFNTQRTYLDQSHTDTPR